MPNAKPEMRVIFTVILLLFVLFLFLPLLILLVRSLESDQGFTLGHYASVISSRKWRRQSGTA